MTKESKKIHINRAPRPLQALSNFLDESEEQGLDEVSFVQTDLQGGGHVTATDGKTVVTGQLNSKGRLRITHKR